jgi:drug/metabolite transporter (DMT)-like permease
MPLSALLLALAAAVVHASWNLLLSDTPDTHAAAAVALVVGVLVCAPFVAIGSRFAASAIPYVAGSSALEVLYMALLATAYSLAAVGLVYPIARGSAPVLVLAAGALALGGRVSLGAATGVVLVGLGIVFVRRVDRASRPRDLALALAVGASIAGYTLVDKSGIRHASPIAYLEAVFAVTAVAYGAGVLRARGVAAIRSAVSARTVLAGVGFIGAYALTLAALRLAPAASVAAVRESSVLIATAVLALSGREEVGRQRLAGAVAVVAGIALISLG